MTDGVAARRELQSRAGSDPSPNRIPQCVTESCLLPFPLWRIDLALTRTIIEIYGGSIWAESCAEGGAIFRFYAAAGSPVTRCGSIGTEQAFLNQRLFFGLGDATRQCHSEDSSSTEIDAPASCSVIAPAARPATASSTAPSRGISLQTRVAQGFYRFKGSAAAGNGVDRQQ